MTRSDVIEQRISKLVSGFGRYVVAYDQQVSFTGEQLAAHRQTIALRRQLGSVRAAASDGQFAAALRRTLLAWGIGRRASRLVPEDEFAAALRTAVPSLEELESLTIDGANLPDDIADRLWLLVSSLGVVENRAKLVAGAKTLHHLLPALVVPMDREYTGRFFQLHLPEWQDPASQRRIFGIVYNQFVNVARRVQPQQYVTSQGWRTSRTKILDNAIIGFCKVELAGLPTDSEDETVNQISFDLLGLPPAKDGANSIFGAGHDHGPRVRLLLEAARQARDHQAFVPIGEGHVALEVVMRASAGQPPWDATNYLGGIGDVLEDKSWRSALDHLGQLAGVWLYRNDRQIKEISYREIEAEATGYTVTVRSLARRVCRSARLTEPGSGLHLEAIWQAVIARRTAAWCSSVNTSLARPPRWPTAVTVLRMIAASSSRDQNCTRHRAYLTRPVDDLAVLADPAHAIWARTARPCSR